MALETALVFTSVFAFALTTTVSWYMIWVPLHEVFDFIKLERYLIKEDLSL